MRSGEPEVREVVARGRSMFPLIADGSRVEIEAIDPALLRPGEIIAFSRDGETVLHRVLQVVREPDGTSRSREKGDNTRFSTWLPGGAVQGRARTARTAEMVVDLATDPRDGRIRLLTALSRAEAWFGDRAARRRAGQGITWRSRAFVLLTAPLRLPALALLRAYPRSVAQASDAARTEMLALFRALAGGGDALPPYRDDLLPLAVSHGLESLWAARAPAVPALQRMRHRAGFQYLSLVTALKQTREALAGGDVPFVVLKGPPLAVRAYGDGAARVGFDIDVLVRRSDRDRAAAALEAAGFRCRSGAVARALIQRGHFHLVFNPPARVNALVELHWELVDRANLYRIDEDAAWTGVRTDASCGVPVGTLGAAEELVYLCLHAAKHAFLNGAALGAGVPDDWYVRPESGNRLIWLVDIARLVERERIDWDAVVLLSRRWNCVEPVFQTLEILDQLRQVPATMAVREALRASLPPQRRGRISVERLGRWMRPQKTLVIRPARLLELRSLFFPGRARLASYYGRATWWHGLLHPLHMARRLLGA